MNAVSATPIPEADVQAYVDGQLAPERAAAVEAAIGGDPDLASRIATMRAQNAALRDALDPALAEPIPAHLLAAAVPPGPRAAHFGRRLAPALAVAATLIVVAWMIAAG